MFLLTNGKWLQTLITKGLHNLHNITFYTHQANKTSATLQYIAT